MKALIQRVSEARVDIGSDVVGRITHGLLILVCAVHGDDEAGSAKLARKIANLRIFEDEAGKMNKSVLDVSGSALVVSQFTLAADTSRGNRPGFSTAAPPDLARSLYETFCDDLRGHGLTVVTGRFGADMAVHLINDGPVTIWLDTYDN